MVDFLIYTLEVIGLTLGVVCLCGLAVRLCARLFSALLGTGSARVFDITAIIGTPIHELGHLLLCPLFAHKVQRVQLWSPKGENGVYGFVEHTYNRKNPWARLGNLFIGIGPIFSGLGVIVLMLWLCFRSQWNEYMISSRALVESGADASALFGEVFALLSSLPSAFSENLVPAILATVVILPVSLHVSLSGADVKESLSAFPIYTLLVLCFSAITFWAGVAEPITAGLHLWGLRLVSLFSLIIAFSLVWVALALLIRAVRTLIRIF